MIRRTFTPAEDAMIRQLRASRTKWDDIATALGCSRSTVITRACRIKVPPPPALEKVEKISRGRLGVLPVGHVLARVG